MKLSFLPAMAMLAALAMVALAAPFDTHGQGEVTLLTPYLQALPSSSALTVGDKYAENPSGLYPTATVPQLQPRADYTVPFQPTYQVLMGNEIQHVGQFKGERLKSELTKALQYLCPDFGAPIRIENSCKINEQYKIQGVEYNDKGWKATNAELRIWVSSAYLPWNARKDFIETAALAYFRETEDSKNCHTETLHTNEGGEAQQYYWCNVGREIEINTINGYGAYLRMNVAFNGKTINSGHFDCKAIQQSVMDNVHSSKVVHYSYTQWFQDRNGYPPNVAVEVWCPDERVTGNSANGTDPDPAPNEDSSTVLYGEDWRLAAWEGLGTGGEWLSGNSP